MKKETNLLLFCIFLFAACQAGIGLLSPSEYIRYLQLPENGMRKSIDASNIKYSVQLATPEFIAAREYDVRQNNPSGLEKRLHELKGSLFFLIAMQSSKALPATLNTDDMAIYYGGPVINDLILHTGHKDLRPVACHFENNLGLAPHNTLVAVFEAGDSLKDDIQLAFNDRFSGNPMIQATFSGRDISALPQLNIR